MGLRTIGALAVALAAFCGSASAAPLTPDAIARAPAISGVNMSREGDMLVGIVADPRNPDQKAIAEWDIANIDPTKPLSPTRITPTDGRMTFQGINALKAGKVLIFANQAWTGSLNGCGEGSSTGATKTWVYKFYLSDSKIDKFNDMSESGHETGISEVTKRCFELATRPSIIDLPLDPDSVVISKTDQTSFESRYFKLNLRTGATEFLYRDGGDQSVALTDPRDGKVLVKLKTEPKGNLEYDVQTSILNPKTGAFDLQEALTYKASDRFTMDVAGFDEETGKYFIITDKFSDKAQVRLYDAATQKFDPEVVFAHPDFDATSVILGRTKAKFGKIMGFTYGGARVETFWVDPEMKAIQLGLDKAFPGQHVALGRGTEDLNRIVFTVDSVRNPPSYYLLLNKTKVVSIGASRPWIKPDSIGEQSLVFYDARDGLKIPGLLTLPAGWKKGDPAPPAVVLPHGGPWARDEAGWDASGWPQILSSRGYAVLQPQYRGSNGWGHNLWVAGDAQWGLKMQDDKDDGARWLVKQGYAKEGSIAIFGYSYGGFAAFAASVRPNGPFKCAIAGAGVANLARIGTNWSENRLQRSIQGRTVTGMDPQANASKLSMPILIFHGDHDVRVPLYHSTDFYASVKGTGKAKLMVMKDQGHQLDKWSPANVRDSLTAITDFLANDCGLRTELASR